MTKKINKNSSNINDQDYLVMKYINNLEKLFNPCGVVVVGASTHPGKFGFVALHNILSNGFDVG